MSGGSYFSGKEISIKDLVKIIIKILNKKIKVNFDTSKPESSFKRSMDISKAKKILQYVPQWSLEEGLKITIDWYKEFIKNRDKIHLI